MTYLLALLVSLVGAALGFALGANAAGLLAPVFGITSFEGASGYFSVFIGGPIGALAGLVLGALLVLRRAGHRSAGAMTGRVVLVLVGAIGLAAAGLGAFWLMRPLTNANGPAPQLVFTEAFSKKNMPRFSGCGNMIHCNARRTYSVQCTAVLVYARNEAWLNLIQKQQPRCGRHARSPKRWEGRRPNCAI